MRCVSVYRAKKSGADRKQKSDSRPNKRHQHTGFVIALLAVVFTMGNISSALADGWNPYSRAPNIDSIANTRHNLSLSYNINAGGAGIVMDTVRNQYVEICVYCHTPHGANSQIDAPLWNRTVNTSQYQIYDKLRTLNRPIGQPGPNSLTCLTCHDGTIAIDSIINMPGSGNYSKAQETSVNTAFLDSWGAFSGLPASLGHFAMGPEAGQNGKCTLCHQVADVFDENGNPTNTSAMSDFRLFALGTDLRDDHPIGILFPDAPYNSNGVDFNEPNLIYTNGGGFRMRVFDFNGNNYPDKDEPRLYDTGDGFEVECASCHDPHGVPSNGAEGKFNPSFLRVNNGVVGDHDGAVGILSNTGSALCLTCHSK